MIAIGIRPLSIGITHYLSPNRNGSKSVMPFRSNLARYTGLPVFASGGLRRELSTIGLTTTIPKTLIQSTMYYIIMPKG